MIKVWDSEVESAEDHFRRLIAEERSTDRKNAAGFVKAIREGDVSAFYRGVDLLSDFSVTGWTIAFRAIARMTGGIAPEIQDAFLEV